MWGKNNNLYYNGVIREVGEKQRKKEKKKAGNEI